MSLTKTDIITLKHVLNEEIKSYTHSVAQIVLGLKLGSYNHPTEIRKTVDKMKKKLFNYKRLYKKLKELA